MVCTKQREREIEMLRDLRLCVMAGLALAIAASWAPMRAGAQQDTMPMHSGTAAKADVLTISAGPGQRGVFTPATLKDYPHVTVTVFDHHTNANETYSGVPLTDLLAKLGVPHGKDLMGKALAQYVVATGADGYKSVVALGEIDPDFHPGQVLICDAMDGKPLDPKVGPFRLLITEDKRPARSVRNLASIEVKTAE